MQIKVFNSRKLNDTQEVNLELATSNLRGECFIGRSPASSLVLDSADVSRLHGKFFQQNGNYYFIDIGSRNGSIINGKLAEINQRYLLKPGDVLRIGEFVLILEEMDVLRQDLADTVCGSTVFGSTDAPVIAIDRFEDELPPVSIASNNEISTSTAEVLENSTCVNTAAEAEDISEKASVDTTFIQSAINSNRETAFCTTHAIAEVEIFTASDTLTEAEKIALGDRPTHIEVFDGIIPQFSITSSEDIDQLPISNKREVDPILDLDPWQDLELESEIALALTQNLVVVEEEAAANTASVVATEKYIALMAHDRQKPELAQFVARHQAFFSQNLTIATPNTSITLQQAGLEVTAETPALPIGGYQAIANLVNSGNVLAVILLKDVLELPPSEQENEAALIRSCNLNQVLLATNLATAEAIVHFLTLGAS